MYVLIPVDSRYGWRAYIARLPDSKLRDYMLGGASSKAYLPYLAYPHVRARPTCVWVNMANVLCDELGLAKLMNLSQMIWYFESKERLESAAWKAYEYMREHMQWPKHVESRIRNELQRFLEHLDEELDESAESLKERRRRRRRKPTVTFTYLYSDYDNLFEDYILCRAIERIDFDDGLYTTVHAALFKRSVIVVSMGLEDKHPMVIIRRHRELKDYDGVPTEDHYAILADSLDECNKKLESYAGSVEECQTNKKEVEALKELRRCITMALSLASIVV